MVLRKRLALLLAASAMSATVLVGCSSTGGDTGSTGGSNGGGAADSKTVLANESARQAIAMSVDKQQMADVILNNGSFGVDYLMAEGLAKNEEGKDYREVAGEMGLSYNVDKAKEAWAKAKEEVGFDTVEFEILTFDSDSSKKVAEFIQAQLSQNLEGATVTIKQQPFKNKLALEEKGEFDISFAGWSPDYPDPLTFLETMQTGVQYAKQTGYSNADYDKLINEAKNAENQADSWAKYAEAEKIMLDDAYIAPLYQKGGVYLEKDYVSGIVDHIYGVPSSYMWADVQKDKKELNIARSSDIPTLDPSKATDTESSLVLMNTMEPLVRVNGKGETVPGAAETWEKSEDGKTWTFKLRKGAKWSNGDEVTAKDFEYSWKRTLNPATASSYGFIMYDIVGAQDYNLGKVDNADGVGIKAIDDYTLEVQLVRPVHYFDQLMFFKSFLPQNQKFVEAQGDKFGTTLENTLYNGPFTVSTWKTEDMYALSKNPTYWDAASVKLEKINAKIVKDSNTAVSLYESGDIDRVGLSAEQVDKYKDSPEFKTLKDAGVFFLQINGGNHQ